MNRQVFTLALPMLGEQFVNFLVTMVDTWLAGQVSREATAAVGAAGYLGWMVTLGFTLLAVGSGAVISRSIGAGAHNSANRAFCQAFALAPVVGLIVTATLFTFADTLALAFTQTPAAHDGFVTYLRLDCLSYALFSIVLVSAAGIRAAGDTRTPMRVMALVNIVNALVSATLVFGWFGAPKLGVTGIAIGTVAARSIGGLAIAWVAWRGVAGLRLIRADLRIDRPMIRRILAIGVPAGADAGVMAVAQMVFVSVVAHTAAGEAATLSFAAHVIAMRLEAITYLPAVAWGTAAATLVGQYLGAGEPRMAHRAGHRAALQCAVLTTLGGLSFFLFARPLYVLMTNDPAVVDIGVGPFRVLAFFQPILAMGIVYVNALRGAGDTRATFFFSLIAGICLRAPLAYLFGVTLGGGLIGAWVGMWADNVIRFILCLTRFIHGGWTRKVV
ncbi:MAG: MATE family efflux transporter [Phycisphaerales bacterium]|nr:MATE family efflux transporter [Phycisphaerales bacterium]